MQKWFLQRAGRYLGATGWVVSPSHALTFDSADAASAGLVDYLVHQPKLVGGDVRVVPLETQQQASAMHLVSVSDYDPFGYGAP